MKRLPILLASFVAVVMTAHAGLIVVSGDSNIGNGIDGNSGSPVADNGVFFKNLLGSGTQVALLTTTNGDSSEVSSQAAIVNFYNGLPGVTANSFGSPVTAGELSGVNLFIAFLPDTSFSAGEISAISAFLNGGGTALFTGEWDGFDIGADNNVNAVLTALGSSLQIVPTDLDNGFTTATGFQILSDPLTAGVASFTYAATSRVTGGTPLFLTTTEDPFIESSGSTVPEPATVVTVAAALGLLALRRRRA